MPMQLVRLWPKQELAKRLESIWLEVKPKGLVELKVMELQLVLKRTLELGLQIVVKSKLMEQQQGWLVQELALG